MIGFRGVARGTLALGMTVSLLGCPLLKKKGADADAGATAVEEESVADASTVIVAGSGAKNEKDVLRYAKEEKLADEAATIGKDATRVRTFPGTGVEVATLAKGTAVVKIAKYFSTGVLITFDDPAGGGKLMGWIPPEALATPTAAVTATATGTATTVIPVKVVDAGVTDAGASAVKDAGATADAGKTATVDAGSTTPPDPGKAVLAVPATNGKCPTGFALLGPLCRRPCNADTDCPRSTFCTATAGVAGKKSCSVSK